MLLDSFLKLYDQHAPPPAPGGGPTLSAVDGNYLQLKQYQDIGEGRAKYMRVRVDAAFSGGAFDPAASQLRASLILWDGGLGLSTLCSSGAIPGYALTQGAEFFFPIGTAEASEDLLAAPAANRIAVVAVLEDASTGGANLGTPAGPGRVSIDITLDTGITPHKSYNAGIAARAGGEV